jgi:hypothetical protein
VRKAAGMEVIQPEAPKGEEEIDTRSNIRKLYDAKQKQKEAETSEDNSMKEASNQITLEDDDDGLEFINPELERRKRIEEDKSNETA